MQVSLFLSVLIITGFTMRECTNQLMYIHIYIHTYAYMYMCHQTRTYYLIVAPHNYSCQVYITGSIASHHYFCIHYLYLNIAMYVYGYIDSYSQLCSYIYILIAADFFLKFFILQKNSCIAQIFTTSYVRNTLEILMQYIEISLNIINYTWKYIYTNYIYM